MRKVLLVEFKFHQEIIPSQLRFLLANQDEVHLFLNEKLWDEYLLGPFKNQIRVELFGNANAWYTKIRLLFMLRRYVKKHKITHLVFNTLNSNFNALVLRFIPSLHVVGIVHRADRLQKKKWQLSAMQKVQGILTLSQETLLNFKIKYPYKEKVSCFYPIFFSKAARVLPEHNSTIYIAIPGQFDIAKKDYGMLVQAARYVREKGIPIKFILLGNASKKDGIKVIEEIIRLELDDVFYYKKSFIPYEEFFQWMERADYVLPLFTKQVKNYDNYLTNQISASFNWAFSFRKKLILPSDFEMQEYVRKSAVFYKHDELNSILASLPKQVNQSVTSDQLSFENQQKQYLSVF